MTRVFAIAIAASSLVACGHVETHEVVLRPPAAAATRDPDLYIEGRGPARPFYEVALLQVVGFGSNANPDDITMALLARAKVLGCDAIVRTHVDQGYARGNGFAVCVRWSGAESAPAPAPMPTFAPTPAPSPAPAPAPAPADL